MKPLILHAHASGPNPMKVAILLENLEVPYEVKLWEIGDADNGVKGPVFTKINENGRVPALEDPNTGVVSWESGAVINYILRNYDKSFALHPGSSAGEQAIVDFEKWIFFLVTTLAPMQGQVGWYNYHNSVKNEDALQRYVQQAYWCFDVLEGQLSKTEGRSILPGGFSAADCHFYPWVVAYTYSKLDISKYEFIQGWLGVIGERPEVKKVYKEIPEAMPAIKK